MYNYIGDNMTELFKDIIEGKKSETELDVSMLPGNIKNKKLTSIAKLFLNSARGKYNIGEISKEDLDILFFEYNKLIRTDEKIINYIASNSDDPLSLGLINHIIVIFMDNFVKNKDDLKKNRGHVKTKINLNQRIEIKGYVEPLLLGVISAGISLLFLANLYLGI